MSPSVGIDIHLIIFVKRLFLAPKIFLYGATNCALVGELFPNCAVLAKRSPHFFSNLTDFTVSLKLFTDSTIFVKNTIIL